MTDTTRIIEEIRAALEKVRHSEWFMSPWHVEEDASAVRNSNDFSFIANTSSDSFAAFIAAVNPLAIRALLDHITAQAEEAVRLKIDASKHAADAETVRRERDAAEARVRELEGADRWQPIETAPNDGTEIILFCPQGDGTPGSTFRLTSGSWFIPPTCTYTPDPEVDCDEPPSWLSWDGGFSEDTMMPTHWRPLPSPPASAILTKGEKQ